MADQQYRRSSSPGRAKRGFSDASISPSPFGGSAPGSALGQSPDLLGIPGSTSMSFDQSAVPRIFSSVNDYTARGSDNPYNTGIFLDGDSDQQQLASDTSAAQWSPSYSLQPGKANITGPSAIPINRFQSEAQPSWTPLRIAPPLRPSTGTAHPQRKLGQRSGPNYRFPPGPGSDLVSRTNDTDEGYYSNSQRDAQSVRSMSTWTVNQEQQHMPPRQMVTPSAYPQSGRGDRGFEQPDSDVQRQEITTDHAVQSQQRPNSLVCQNEGCNHDSKTQSEFKKHAARHNKEHICREPGCQRTEGFATINDLERHQKSVHKIQPEHGHSKEYKCFGDSCPKHDKEWPRFDNFKQHLKRMHERESMEMLIQRSNEWYEQQKKPHAMSETRPSQRPSTSSSQQASVQSAVQTGPRFLTPERWSQHSTTDQGRAVHTGPLNRGFGTHYTQSEFGHYSTSGSGSNTSHNMSRPPTGQLQLQPNLISCPGLGCSQCFTNADLFREHLRSRHGLQKVAGSLCTGMQNQVSTWERSQSSPGIHPVIPSRPYGSMQKSASNTARLQSPYQSQTRLVNGGNGPRTAPNPSLPAVQNRLDEDFETSAMMQPQEPLFATGSSENFLVQIGMMDQLQHDVTQTTNLGFDSSHEQPLALNVQEDQQKKPASPLSIDAVKSFLREHFPNDRIDFAASVVQGTLQSLQGTSSNGDVSNTPAASSLLDMSNVRSSMQDGKQVYHCPQPGCEKHKARKCELRKHVQRHILPWTCTFDKCPKQFGSKNDWTRHENKQHEQQECWRCGEADSNESGRSVPASDDDACMRVFFTKDLYSKHLREAHKFQSHTVINKMCEKQRIGAKGQVRFWCGFCNEIIPLKMIGVDGAGERYNHIDYHVSKEHRNANSWKPLNARPSAGDSALTSEHTSPADSCCSGSNEEGGEDDAAGEAHATQSTHTPQDSRKRPAPASVAGDQGLASKVARSTCASTPRGNTEPVVSVYCCRCGEGPFSNKICEACTDGNCQHVFCSSCKYGWSSR